MGSDIPFLRNVGKIDSGSDDHDRRMQQELRDDGMANWFCRLPSSGCQSDEQFPRPGYEQPNSLPSAELLSLQLAK